MSDYQLRQAVYNYLRDENRSTLAGMADAIDANISDVLDTCKRLRDEGYIESANSERIWTFNESEAWTCPECGDEQHESLIFPLDADRDEVEVDVTCESVYVVPAEGGDGFAFSHDEFEELIEQFNESEYTR